MNILSNRSYEPNASWQIVHEWEDDFSAYFNSTILEREEHASGIVSKIRYHKNIYPFLRTKKADEKAIVFNMVAPYTFTKYSGQQYIPIIIDTWKNDLDRIAAFCAHQTCVFVGSKEAEIDLKKRGMKNVCYLPVSISKKYYKETIPDTKDIDLLMYGRNHTTLWTWASELYSGPLHIVQCARDKAGLLRAYSNKYGEIGLLTNRSDLMTLLEKSRYTMVSSPGNDPLDAHDISRTGGYSPITPRFFEAAVNYSIGIGIFPDNPDYTLNNIQDISIRIQSLEELKEHLFKTTNLIDIKDRFDTCMKQHWTDQRAQTVSEYVSAMI